MGRDEGRIPLRAQTRVRKYMQNICLPLLYTYVIFQSVFSAPLWRNVEDVGFKG